jgi:iron(III) transport system permease protein
LVDTLTGTPPVGWPESRKDRVWLALSRFRGAPLAAFWVLIVVILGLPVLLFLAVAFSPRLFAQGPEWFTLSGFSQAFTGTLLQGVVDSLFVGVMSALAATAVGFAIAWLVIRTDLPGRRVWTGVMFALLLAPSYLVALGWERLLEPSGVLDVAGFHLDGFRSLFYGPFGVIVVLSAKGVPFAFLAISGALRGLGEEFESAVRVHGGGPIAAARILVGLLAPAIWSALAIVFAESVSDFGVAATLTFRWQPIRCTTRSRPFQFSSPSPLRLGGSLWALSFLHCLRRTGRCGLEAIACSVAGAGPRVGCDSRPRLGSPGWLRWCW